ncbi:MAG: phosphotransferase family protein [Frankiaceae bacterium]
MLTRPADLPDAVVADAVREGWGIAPAGLAYRAIGFGSHHWQATDGDGRWWFVTVDDLTARPLRLGEPPDAVHARLRAALATARAVRDAGAAFVVAPVRRVDGDVVGRIGERYAVAVYPYVHGRPRDYDGTLAPADRRAVLEIVVALHEASAAASSMALAEGPSVPLRDGLTAALEDVATPWCTGPYADRARALLARRGGDVERWLRRHDALVAQARELPERLVLTHGEPHPGNLIETAAGWLLVDWDTTLLAQPERDLWLLDEGDGRIGEAYAELTGRPVLPAMMQLYELGWRLSDIAAFVAWFRKPHDDSDDSTKSWRALTSYFAD